MCTWLRPIASDFINKRFELCLLSRTREPDPLCKPLSVRSRDPEVEGIGSVIRHRFTRAPDVREGVLARGSRVIDAASDPERTEQLLHVPEEQLAVAAEPHIATRLAVLDT